MSEGKRAYTRFSVVQRIEHVVMFTSFIVLAVTGLPQKFAEAGISQAIINLLGGIETTRQIHHVAAIVLLLSAAFHFVAVGYRLFVRRSRPAMLPGLKDVRDGLNDFLYNFGLRKRPSQGGRYTWMEKVEYWALVWGTLVMALTGFFMWNPIATTEILPGEAIPAAKMAHGWEAVLAVTAVIIWHFYSVHLKRLNKSMFTGKLSEHEMLEEHPLELADIKAGILPRPRDPKYSKRQAIYVPIASVVGAVMVVAIFRFMTFEKTAIDTIPQRFHENVQIFAPLTPTPFPASKATPTAVAVANAGWPTVGAILEKECATCHNGTVAGLDFTTYAGAMKGGRSGSVIKAGDPDHSLIMQKVASGAHPGKFSPAELEALRIWIAGGANEFGEGTPVTAPTPGPALADVWTGGIDQLVNAKCAMCHVEAAMGNLSLKTYADALKGGKSGPAIVPNNPDKSVLVQVQQKGGHAGQLTPAELARVTAWIKAGAPEKGDGASVPASTAVATPTPLADSNAVTQWRDAQTILVGKCAACHINRTTAGVSFASYADVINSTIIPGDPDNSVLLKMQKAGGHPGQLSPAEIARLAAWIKAGAPEKSDSASTSATGGTATPVAWATFATILNSKCGSCHVNAQMGGLSVKTYADVLKGGEAGPAVVPGQPDQSVLVKVQQAGNHASVLSADELAALIAWIKAGAPETAGTASGAAPTATPAPITVKNWAAASAILTAKCAACHINAQAGNLSLKTYAATVKGGKSGPAIVRGNPDKSVLVTTQQGTSHPATGMLTPEELAAIIAWIKAGAPQY